MLLAAHVEMIGGAAFELHRNDRPYPNRNSPTTESAAARPKHGRDFHFDRNVYLPPALHG